MINDYKPNDFVAATLNSAGKLTLDDFKAYDLTPDNTGIKDENYYKNIPQIQEKFQTKDGEFDNEAYTRWYDSTLNLYNTWANDDYTDRLIQSIETSPNDIFSLGNYNIRNDEAKIVSIKDPQRHSMGLGNIYEAGDPTFDIREVAQDNYVLDENGNQLDWTPNDKGGFIKGLFRPTLVLATYDKDTDVMENGIMVHKRKGDLILKNGDPCYQIPGNKNLYDKEILQYTDTFTRDDSFINKFDFFDSDGLDKSIGGTITKIAFMLAPYFIPYVGPALGWVGAGLALGQTLPILGKAIDGIATGTTQNNFGKTMTSIENALSRFNGSTSRKGMESFWNFENIGKMIYDSAGQLFQQRNIINASQKLLEKAGKLNAQKIGSAISLSYMAATSSNDAYSTFKQMGMDDAMAGAGVLGVMAGIFSLMNSGYLFKDAMFKGTWLDEDQTFREAMKAATKANKTLTEKALNETGVQTAESVSKKSLIDNIKWMKSIKDATIKFFSKGEEEFNKQVLSEGILGTNIPTQSWWKSMISRGVNEGVEEMMEENVTDIMKSIALALQSMGINVSEDKDKRIEWGETINETLARYATAGIGGFIGGATFSAFDQYQNFRNEKTNPFDKNLFVNLTRIMADPNSRKEAYAYVDKLEKKGKTGNANLSTNVKIIKADDGSTKVVYTSGDNSNNQNIMNANTLRQLLKAIESSINDSAITFTFDAVHDAILDRFTQKAKEQDMTLTDYLQKNNIDIGLLTAKEKGYTKFIYDNLSYKLAAIVEKTLEIDNRKAEIKREGNYTDAQHAKYEEDIKKDVSIKEKEKELTELKKEYTDFSEGKYNDQIVSFINFASNPSLFSAYFNDPKYKNENESAIPELNVENFVKTKTGKGFDKLSEPEKKYYTKQWKELINSDDFYNRLRNAYYLHYNLSDRMTKDIVSVDNNVNTLKPIGTNLDVTARIIDAYIDSIDQAINIDQDPGNLLIYNHIKANLEVEKENLKDPKRKLELIINPEKIDKIINKINSEVQAAPNLVSIISNMGNHFYGKLIDDKILYKNDSILNSANILIDGALKRVINWNEPQSINEFLKFYTPLYNFEEEVTVDNSVDFAIGKFLLEHIPIEKIVKKLLYLNDTQTIDDVEEIISKFNDDDITAFNDILTTVFAGDDIAVESTASNDYGDRSHLYEILGLDKNSSEYIEVAKSAAEEINNIKKNLPSAYFKDDKTQGQKLLNSLIAMQLDFKTNNIEKAKNDYNNFLAIIDGYNLKPSDKNEFIQNLFIAVKDNGVKESLISKETLDNYFNNTVNNYNNIQPNPVNDLLKKLDTYNGKKYEIAINLFNQEWERFNSMGTNAADNYIINSPLYENSIKQINGLLNIIEAISTSATNGDNKQINAFRNLVNLSSFAEISDNTRQIIADGINSLRNKIDLLLKTSAENAGKVLMQQIDTVINCEPKTINKIIDLFDIAQDGLPDNDKIDVKTIFSNALRNNNVTATDINKNNYADYKKAINQFQIELYHAVNNKYKTEDELLGFVKKFINKINGLGNLAQTDLSADVETITDFTAIQSFIINILENPADIDEKYNETRKEDEFKNIIPFYSQEIILKSSVVKARHENFINEVLKEIRDKARTEIEANTELSDDDKNYLIDRVILNNFFHIDGTAGAGKTEMLRMVQSILSKYGDVKVLYSTLSEKHLKNDILPRFGVAESSGITINEIMKELLGDKWDESDWSKYGEKKNGHVKLKDDIKNDLIDRLNDKKIKDFFDKSFNGKKVLCIDEDGFLNQPILTALSIYADAYNISLIGTGDTTQNGMNIDGVRSGLTEDFFSWNSPFLAISMRTNNNGQKFNQEKLFKILNEIREEKYNNPAIRVKDLNDLTDNKTASTIELMYDDEQNDYFCGEKKIKNTDEEKIKTIVLFKNFVKQLNDSEPDGKKNHRVVVVADSKTSSLYTAYADDSLTVVDKDSIQGGQADYVLVDRTNWDKDNSYTLLQDVYTMMSRAKNGCIFTDNEIFDKLNLKFSQNEMAGVRLTDEQFQKSVENYKTWREGLPEMIDNSITKKPIISSSSTPLSATSSTAISNTTTSTTTTSTVTSNGSNSTVSPSLANGIVTVDPENKINVENSNNKNDDEWKKEVEEARNLLNETIAKDPSKLFASGDALVNSINTVELVELNRKYQLTKNNNNYPEIVALLSKAIIYKIVHDSYNNAIFGNEFIEKLSNLSDNKLNENLIKNLFNDKNKKFTVTTNGFLLFKSNGLAIPIAKLNNWTGSVQLNVAFDKLKINMIKGAKAISTKGLHRFKISDIFPKTILSDNPVSVLAPSLSQISNDNKNGTRLFAINNNGKAMLHILNDPSLPLDVALSPQLNESGLIKYFGDPEAVINVGVQNTIDFENFIEICRGKQMVLNGDPKIQETGKQILRNYFGNDAVSAATANINYVNNRPDSNFMNSSYSRKMSISQFSTLHWSSINSLISALMCFYKETNNPNKTQFINNYINAALSRDGKRTSGFSLTYTNNEGTIESINIIPDDKNLRTFTAYVTSGSENDAVEGIKIDTGENITLKNWTELDFENFINSILTACENVKDTVPHIEKDQLYDKLKDGIIAFGLCSMVNKGADNSKIYAVFDTTIANLVKKEDGKPFDDIKEIANWISQNSIFKYGLYANIIAGKDRDGYGTGENQKLGWKLTDDSQNWDDLTTDIIEYHEPIYQIDIDEATNSEPDPNDDPQIGTIVEIGVPDSSNFQEINPADANGNRGVSVNNKWLEENVKDYNNSDLNNASDVLVISFNAIDKTAIIEYINADNEIKSKTIELNNIDDFKVSEQKEINNNIEKFEAADGTIVEKVGDELVVNGNRIGTITKIPGSNYSWFWDYDGNKHIINDTNLNYSKKSPMILIAANQNGEKLRYNPINNAYTFIDSDGNELLPSLVKINENKISVKLNNEQETSFVNNDIDPENWIIPKLINSDFVKVEDYYYYDNFKEKFKIENNTVYDSDILFRYIESKLRKANNVDNLIRDAFAKVIDNSRYEELAEWTINKSDNDDINKRIEEINDYLKEYAKDQFDERYEISLNNGKFIVRSINFEYYGNRAKVHTMYQDAESIEAEHLGNYNDFIVTLKNGEKWKVRINSDKTISSNKISDDTIEPSTQFNVSNDKSHYAKELEIQLKEIFSENDLLTLYGSIEKFIDTKDLNVWNNEIEPIYKEMEERNYDPTDYEILNELEMLKSNIKNEKLC